MYHVAIVTNIQRVGNVRADMAFTKDVPVGENLKGVRVTLFVQEPESGRIWGQRCSAPHVNVHCRDYALNPKSREKFRYVLRDLNAILRQRTMRKVKPGAAKVALERVAPKHAEQPVERTARRVDAVRVAIGTKKRNGL